MKTLMWNDKLLTSRERREHLDKMYENLQKLIRKIIRDSKEKRYLYKSSEVENLKKKNEWERLKN